MVSVNFFVKMAVQLLSFVKFTVIDSALPTQSPLQFVKTESLVGMAVSSADGGPLEVCVRRIAQVVSAFVQFPGVEVTVP